MGWSGQGSEERNAYFGVEESYRSSGRWYGVRVVVGFSVLSLKRIY